LDAVDDGPATSSVLLSLSLLWREEVQERTTRGPDEEEVDVRLDAGGVTQ
jgi:hypothetical protein